MSFNQTGFEDFWRIAQSFADNYYREQGLGMQKKQMAYEQQMGREQLGVQREQLQLSKQSLQQQVKQAQEEKERADKQYDLALDQWEKTKEHMGNEERRAKDEEERAKIKFDNEQKSNEMKAKLDELALKQSEIDLKYRDKYWEAQIANLYESGANTAQTRANEQIQSDFRSAWRGLMMNIIGAKTYDQLMEIAPMAGVDLTGLKEETFNYYKQNNPSILNNYLKTMAAIGLSSQYPGLSQDFVRSFADPWTIGLPEMPEGAGKPRRFSLGGKGGTVGEAVKASIGATFGKPQILPQESPLMGQPLPGAAPRAIEIETSQRGAGLAVAAPPINKTVIINGQPYTAIIQGTQPLRVFDPKGASVKRDTPEYLNVFDQLFPGMK